MPDGRAVTMESMLHAREARAQRQSALKNAYHRPLISFTLNIPGPVKTGTWLARAFDMALTLLVDRFCPIDREVLRADTGYHALLVVDGEPIALKKMAVAIEEADEIGRLYDIDVLAPDGRHISRSDIAAPPRRCLICEGEAHACARSRAHDMAALLARVDEIVLGHVGGRIADQVAALAVRALLHEVCVAPKPGLVDRMNNGAHDDMDIFSFMDSASHLGAYFRACASIGFGQSALSPDALFDRLREPGMRAESAMLRATGGVNTHKGAIYSLGILCAALGRSHRLGLPITPQALAALAGDMARAACERELGRVTPRTATTAGERMYLARGAAGIRGEVAGGFQSVLRHGLPALAHAREAGLPHNDACAVALVHLIAYSGDTVLAARAGAEYDELTHRLRAQLRRTPLPSMGDIAALDRDFTARRLSPGGSADLLAVTLLLDAACENTAPARA